jgi:hypothetical protein
MLKEFGEVALITAAQCADELLGEGDVDGFCGWCEIVAALEELQRTERRPGEALN